MNCLFRQPHASIPRNKGRFLGTPVKHGANDRCAYGGVGGPLSTWSAKTQAPLRGYVS